MAKISSLSIGHLLGKGDTTRLSFSEGINVLYGRNGRGKTTILNFIASAFTNDPEYIKLVDFTECRARINAPEYDIKITKSITRRVIYQSSLNDKRLYGEESLISIDFMQGEYDDLLDTQLFKWKNSDSVESDLPLEMTYLGVDRIHKFIKDDNDENTTPFSNSIKILWTNYNSQILSKIQSRQEDLIIDLMMQESSPIEMDKNISWDKYENLVKFVESRPRFKSRGFEIEPHSFYTRYIDDLGFKRLVDEIYVMQKYSEDVEYPRNLLLNILSDLFSDDISIRFFQNNIHFYSSNGRRIYMDRLSSGEKHLLFILINVANAGSNAVIIDEPELSMHVSWQKKLLPAISKLNPNAQIIMATHSPEILTSSDAINIIKI